MIAGYTLSPRVICRAEAFGGLVFQRDSWALHKVNETGLAILKACSGDAVPVEQLLGSLSASGGELDSQQQRAMGNYLDQLVSMGIIVETHEGEQRSAQPVSAPSFGTVRPSYLDSWLPRSLSAPVFVWWDITAACNLKCKQCYSSSGSPMRDELTTDEVKGILDQLARMGVFYIYFLGGEPFLRKDFLAILEHTASLGLEIMVNSNGWFISAELARRLKQIGVRHVRVSIDGATAETHDMIRGMRGSFERATRAVRTLKQAGITVVGISPTVMHENVSEVESLIQLAHGLEVDEIQFVQVCAVGRGSEISTLDPSEVLVLKDAISRKSRDFGDEISITGSEGVWEKPFARCVLEGRMVPDVMGCGAAKTCLAISPNGHVRACLLFQYEVGDLRQQSFEEIWRGTDNPALQWLRSVKDGCEGCEYAPICSGPCPMQKIIPATQRAQFVEVERSTGGQDNGQPRFAVNSAISADRHDPVCS